MEPKKTKRRVIALFWIVGFVVGLLVFFQIYNHIDIETESSSDTMQSIDDKKTLEKKQEKKIPVSEPTRNKTTPGNTKTPDELG